MSNKKKKEHIGVIKGIDVVKKSAPFSAVSFRTGKFQTKKDKPRDKSYKRNYFKDW